MTRGMALVEAAHAKINLFLHVVGRRPDGYHLLDSLAVFAGAHDLLAAEPSAAPGIDFSVHGRFGEALRREDPADNLVMRAVHGLLGEAGSRGLTLGLEKNLPVASGIGGGSADAAAALRLVSRLRPELADSKDRIAALAERLGADVPVCLAQRPARMRGIGERLGPAPALPSCFMVLVNCGRAVSTPAVFRARAPGFRPEAILPEVWPDAASMAGDLAALSNDLQAPAVALCPQIADVLGAIGATQDCLLSRMSGSGATCFGLFATLEQALRAAQSLDRPEWWVWGGAVLGPSEAPHEIPSI